MTAVAHRQCGGRETAARQGRRRDREQEARPRPDGADVGGGPAARRCRRRAARARRGCPGPHRRLDRGRDEPRRRRRITRTTSSISSRGGIRRCCLRRGSATSLRPGSLWPPVPRERYGAVRHQRHRRRRAQRHRELVGVSARERRRPERGRGRAIPRCTRRSCARTRAAVAALLAHGADPNAPLRAFTPGPPRHERFLSAPRLRRRHAVLAGRALQAAVCGCSRIMVPIRSSCTTPRAGFNRLTFGNLYRLAEGSTTAVMAGAGLGGREPLIAADHLQPGCGRFARRRVGSRPGRGRGDDAQHLEVIDGAWYDLDVANAEDNAALHAADSSRLRTMSSGFS